MTPIPQGAPQSLGEAFAHINALTAPSVTDLKVMVLIEAAGQTLYEVSAEGSDHEGVKALLIENGHEEMKHAGRVSAAIKLLSGEDFPPPTASENPYLTGVIPRATLTAEGLKKTAEAEFAGDRLYTSWADSLDNQEAAALLRLNAREESDHGNRLLKAAALLEG
jgi:rubrerythrin